MAAGNSGEKPLPSQQFEVIEVSKEALSDIWVTPVSFNAHYDESAFDRQWVILRDALRNALSARWKEGYQIGDDFFVSDDRNNAWAQCGGVYSQRICCPDYALTVMSVLASVPDSNKWAYHTAIEVQQAAGGLPRAAAKTLPQFVLKTGRMFVPKDGNNYARFFAQAKAV